MASLETLRKSIKGDIVTPSDSTYEEAIKRWAANATRRAKLVVFVKDADDVAAALKYAKATNTHIAVRGGGHSPAGASSTETGMVIDLSRYLTNVKIDPAKKLAYVQGGALWGQVDEAAAEHGLATVGGTVNHTGVGGLATGGGYGYLSGQHGLVIDNIAEATVVTANGSILKASSTDNPDLYFGIRGGGSNFGIVVEFVLSLHPHPNNVYGGTVIFTADKLPALRKEFMEWWPTATEKEAINCLVTRLIPHREPGIVLVMFYDGSKADAEKYHKRFTDIGPIADLRQEMPYKNMNGLMNGMAEHGRCCWMRGAVMDDIPRMMSQEIFDKIIGHSEDGRFDVTVFYEFVPHGKINSVPAYETPYCRHLPGNVLILVNWDDNIPEKSKEGLDIATELASMVKGPGEPYGNYTPDTESLPIAEGPVKPNRAKALFREHYPKMQEIKRKYDPDMMFNKWYVINPTAV